MADERAAASDGAIQRYIPYTTCVAYISAALYIRYMYGGKDARNWRLGSSGACAQVGGGDHPWIIFGNPNYNWRLETWIMRTVASI